MVKVSPYRVSQGGFSLVEVSIVTAIMILLSIMGIPAIQGYVIENKVPQLAGELQRVISRLKVASIGLGATPYAGLSNAVLANALRDSSIVAVTGQGPQATIGHGLGGSGQNGEGVIRLTPHALGGPHGSAFELVLNHVNHAACPALASVMQRVASIVTVAGQSGAVEVKNAATEPPRPYQPLLADAQCARGDRNTFTFVIR